MSKGDEAVFPTDGYFEGGLTKRELAAIENHAQLLRFVIRGQLTPDDAVKVAVGEAEKLFAALDAGKEG